MSTTLEEVQQAIKDTEKAIAEQLAARQEITMVISGLRRELDRLRSHEKAAKPPSNRWVTAPPRPRQ